MKTLINLPNPSADWQGLANVISKSSGLREDVVLVVEREGLRFFDAERREIEAEIPEGDWTESSMNQLATKLSLLDWLYERFPIERRESVAASSTAGRPASYFSAGPGDGSRWDASQSTS